MRTMKEAIGQLQEEIRSLAIQSREIRVRRRHLKEQGPATGPDRDQLWREKKMLGWEARRAILAAGLLRGRPYRRMERKTENDVRPSAFLIGWKIRYALGVDPKADYWKCKQPPEERAYIEAWLAVPDEAPQQMAEAAE